MQIKEKSNTIGIHYRHRHVVFVNLKAKLCFFRVPCHDFNHVTLLDIFSSPLLHSSSLSSYHNNIKALEQQLRSSSLQQDQPLLLHMVESLQQNPLPPDYGPMHLLSLVAYQQFMDSLLVLLFKVKPIMMIYRSNKVILSYVVDWLLDLVVLVVGMVSVGFWICI